MGLPLRMTFKEEDYTYQIINSNLLVDRNTTELDVLINGEKVKLQKDTLKSWVQTGGEKIFDPELIQALGRSVSLRLRL